MQRWLVGRPPVCHTLSTLSVPDKSLTSLELAGTTEGELEVVTGDDDGNGESDSKGARVCLRGIWQQWERDGQGSHNGGGKVMVKTLTTQR